MQGAILRLRVSSYLDFFPFADITLKDLAVMKAILAMIYASLESYIVDDRGIEQDDGFIAGPKSGGLTLGFRQVSA